MKFDFGKKKKKKKNKDLDLAEGEAAVKTTVEQDQVTKNLEGLKLEEGSEAAPVAGEETLDFSKMKKKDKKAQRVTFSADGTIEFQTPEEAAKSAQNINQSDQSSAWQESERDYNYDELLERVFNIIKEKNPDMVTGEKKRFTMKPPDVSRVGTRKTLCRHLSYSTQTRETFAQLFTH